MPVKKAAAKKPCKAGTILNPRTGRCVLVDRPLGKIILARKQASNAEAAFVAKNVAGKIFNRVRKTNYDATLAAKNCNLDDTCLAAEQAIQYLQAQLRECDAKLRRALEREEQFSQLLLQQRRV